MHAELLVKNHDVVRILGNHHDLAVLRHIAHQRNKPEKMLKATKKRNGKKLETSFKCSARIVSGTRSKHISTAQQTKLISTPVRRQHVISVQVRLAVFDNVLLQREVAVCGLGGVHRQTCIVDVIKRN